MAWGIFHPHAIWSARTQQRGKDSLTRIFSEHKRAEGGDRGRAEGAEEIVASTVEQREATTAEQRGLEKLRPARQRRGIPATKEKEERLTTNGRRTRMAAAGRGGCGTWWLRDAVAVGWWLQWFSASHFSEKRGEMSGYGFN
ncbi:uncharacterized protein DS421_5g141220 [Arachis hypogaea]|nr:uncharacterized protein DS421_5g141220 [Arachis hypogaea]